VASRLVDVLLPKRVPFLPIMTDLTSAVEGAMLHLNLCEDESWVAGRFGGKAVTQSPSKGGW
jgi:hypothetical protein